MSSQLTGEHMPPRPQKSEATVSVKVREDDLLGLQVLATVAGISESDSGSFAELLTSTLHLGVIDSYKTTGLTWPPNPAGFGAGKRFSALGDKRADEAPSHRPDTQTLRNLALSAVAVATIVVIVGSYAGHWSWTGLTQNGQVWDWMQLLLLPVALGTFPLWLRFSGQMSSTRRKALGGAVTAFAGFVLAGYLVPLTWTGFRGHTLWNWLTLIVLPITITTATSLAEDTPDFPPRLSRRRSSPRRRMDRDRDWRVRRRLGLDRLSGQHVVGLGRIAARAHRHHHLHRARAHQNRLGQRRRPRPTARATECGNERWRNSVARHRRRAVNTNVC